VSVIANSGLWKGGKDSKLREDLINEGIIEGVIQLPERLLSGIGISVALLILSENNERIRFVDASNIYTRGRRQNTLEKEDINKIINAYYKDTEISRWVTTEEISKQEYILEPERYFDSKLKFENGLLLAELCISIKRGTMIKATELDEMINTNPTQYHYLMLQNINEGIIDSKLPYLKKIDDKLKKYCINDKNLIISKTSPFKIATVNVKEGEQILANGNLYILDLDETKINPVFVEAFLQSKAGKKQLYKFAKGSAVKSISIRDLTTIRIPDLSKEEQNTIAEEYSRLLDQQKKIRQQVEIIRDRKNNIFEKIK
jgi:type I restriction enzyme M protein